MANLKKCKNVLVLQLFLILVGVLVLFLIKSNIIYKMPVCTIRTHIGIICPSCGGTRCVINLMQLNFKQAFIKHPTICLAIIYLGIADFLYIINSIFKKNYLKFLYPSIPILIIFLIMYCLQYIVRLCLIFNGVDINI